MPDELPKDLAQTIVEQTRNATADRVRAAWTMEVETLRAMVGRQSEDIGPRRIVRDLQKRIAELQRSNGHGPS